MSAPHPLTLWLVRNGLPRKAFCEDAKISEGYLSALISGHKRPSLWVSDRISKATGGAITAQHFPGNERTGAPSRF